VSDHQITLIHLDEPLRWEAIYALQQRDARGGRIDPVSTRTALRIMAKYPSFATLTEAELDGLVRRSLDANVTIHIVEFARVLRNAHDEFTGCSPSDRLVWDLVDVGICPDPALKGGARRRRGVNFGEIAQPWFRHLTMAMAREQTRAYQVNELQKVAVLASRVLDERSDRGMDMSQLGHNDADAIAKAIRDSKTGQGQPFSSQYRRQVYRRFFRMVDFGRRQGLLEDLPMSFMRDRSHVIPHDPIEDEFGKSIPIHVQRQLDARVDEIGRHVTHPGLTSDQRHQMFLTIYMLLRDTGRRSLEVASLKTNYLTRDANGPILIYDNHKAGRYGRRLPIVQSTADVIADWLKTRTTLNIHEASREYLFPGTTAHQNHVTSTKIAAVLRDWVDRLDQLDSNEVDKHGNPLPFDRHLVHARAFRHTYAQRHADTGTPVDVLRVLMDHRSVQTTGLYYVITADRKREAIQKVGEYTIDRNGVPTPLTQSTRYQMRSVAVPFGNCIEPSNVKAGGQACPIRFQCAGCGFYRPDPSFIPAIEEHLNSLRADRETAQAMEAATFVIDNLNAQIVAFKHVLRIMRQRLESLDPAERDRIEDGAAALRKVRAGGALPLTVVNRSEEQHSG
jgi:integrase